MVTRLLCKENETGLGAGLQSTVEEVITPVVRAALVETVIGSIQQLRGGRQRMGPEEIERGTLPEALRGPVMQR